MDSEGNEITEEEQLGLLLYRGGTVCYEWSFKFDSADAICRQMNFTRAERWTTNESYDIQSNYPIYLRDVRCNSNGGWPDNCGFYEETGSCKHNQDVFLSCTSKAI